MISAKKLNKLARKWKNLAAASRKKISLPRTNTFSVGSCSSSSSSTVAEKGHFVVYTIDQRRFMIPLTYLKTKIFKELLRLAEEEFGVPSDGPITLPCDSTIMEYAISVTKRHATKELEKALVLSLASCRYTSLLHKEHNQQQLVISGF